MNPKLTAADRTLLLPGFRIPFGPFCTRADCCAANRHVEACPVMVQLRAYLKEIRSKR